MQFFLGSCIHSHLWTLARLVADEKAKQLRRDSTKRLGAKNVGNGGPPIVELLLDLHTDLGESIIWDERVQRLYFVDINAKKIYGCTCDGTDLLCIDCEEMVGAIALTTDANLLLAAMNR